MDILIVDHIKGLISLEEGVAREHIYCLRVIDLQFLLDDHYKFKHCEGLQDQDSAIRSSLLAVVELFQFRVASPAQ